MPGPVRAEDATEKPFTVLSFNLRNDNPEDGPNAWPHRKDLAAATIIEHEADFVGLQEALVGQLRDLDTRLPGYDRVGVGRDDGKARGEHCAILFRKDRFSVLSSGTFWLSETPEIPGKLGWDAVCPRVATWGVFEERATRRRLLLVNTHLDHKGPRAQQEGARLIAHRIAELRGDAPSVVVTGDFNSSATDPAIRALLADDTLNLRLARERRTAADVGGNSTFHGWKNHETGEEIDFILVTPTIEVLDYRFLHVEKDGVLISDHWPVLGKFHVTAGGKR